MIIDFHHQKLILISLFGFYGLYTEGDITDTEVLLRVNRNTVIMLILAIL